jgi:arsenate reductase (glutaredoxin)
VAELNFYEKPTCTTCKKTANLLEERGVDFARVNYYVEPLDEDKLRDLLRKAGLRPRDAMRTKEPVYSELGLAGSERSDDELIELMVEHPDLVQRPIVERGDHAVLARPPERVLELLD